jgi:hypothetical protein
MIFSDAHEGVVGGHYAWNKTTHNIVFTRLWWPTLHKDAKEFCKTCDVYQRIGKHSKREKMSLVPQVTLQAFDKWEVYFNGPINPLEKRT